MTTNYDPIAELYKRSKQQPWRTSIEAFSLMELIGDVRDKSVLDVACGEGFYTRMLRQRGADRVVGVDLSEGMVDLARRQETQLKQGIDYRQGDARDLSFDKPFDLVVAAYLLNYARNQDELQSMCDGLARCLGAGGRFVTVNSSPHFDFSTAPSFRKYGFETQTSGPWTEGAPVKWKFYLEDSSFEIENYHLDGAAHEAALWKAGFREVRWHAPRVSPQGLADYPSGHWTTFLDTQPVVLIECLI